MKRVLDTHLTDNQAALWFLGQAGYIAKSGGITLAIDTYLTDSAAVSAPAFSRLIPVPITPEDLKVDILLFTHDHTDHLDPETVVRYPHKSKTFFVAPRLAGRKLLTLGVPQDRIVRVDVGETTQLLDITITGIFALATGPDVFDTTGYLVSFPNGRSFYHTSDTSFCDLLLEAAPEAEVLLVPINGKWGNLNVDQALTLTNKVSPRFVLPNHYDMMQLNSENPETFRYLCENSKINSTCVILNIMEPFIWK